MSANNETVRFMVGGRYHVISKALIEKHQDTMLARLVLDDLQANPTATIFINRDGEMFQYVIDFLRFGRVSLPWSVSREMFLHELDYFGFYNVPNENIIGISTRISEDTQKQNLNTIRWVANTLKSTFLVIERVNLEIKTMCLEMAHDVSSRPGEKELNEDPFS